MWRFIHRPRFQDGPAPESGPSCRRTATPSPTVPARVASGTSNGKSLKNGAFSGVRVLVFNMMIGVFVAGLR